MATSNSGSRTFKLLSAFSFLEVGFFALQLKQTESDNLRINPLIVKPPLLLCCILSCFDWKKDRLPLLKSIFFHSIHIIHYYKSLIVMQFIDTVRIKDLDKLNLVELAFGD